MQAVIIERLNKFEAIDEVCFFFLVIALIVMLYFRDNILKNMNDIRQI